MNKTFINLSIITLTYNNPNDLEKTLDSLKILKNSAEKIEFIIIDSSEKNTFQRNKESIKLIRNLGIKCKHLFIDACGIYNSMNYGISQCKGEYLIFMNAGDSFYKGFKINNFFSLVKKGNSNKPFLIHGRARIKSSINPKLIYLNPPLHLNPTKRYFWSKVSTPMHQACFFLTKWHEKNFYPLNRGYRADQIIKKRALKSSFFINEIICNYELSGISSLNNLTTQKIFINSIKTKSLYRIIINLIKIILIKLLGKKWEYIRFYKNYLLSKFLP